MDYEEKLVMMLCMHFEQPTKKKKLKCKYCADFLSNLCEGKDLNHKGVLKCMQDKVNGSEFIYSEDIFSIYDKRRPANI